MVLVVPNISSSCCGTQSDVEIMLQCNNFTFLNENPFISIYSAMHTP
jgi:hypothetical protein